MTTQDDSIAAAKQRLRVETRALRDVIAFAERETRSAALIARLQQIEGFASAAVVHTYVGVGSEAGTLLLIKELLDHGVRVVCPRIAAGDHLEHREIASIDELVQGAIGLVEPDPTRSSEVPLSEFQMVLVPSLAFTRDGYRLGYGRGYYDRLLATCEATAIGLAFDSQMVDELPQQVHDRAVDIVVTESETIHTGARR